MNEPDERSGIATPARYGPPLALFLIALAFRAGMGLYGPTATAPDGGLPYDDERWYWAMAESLRHGDGLVGEFGHRAERMPLYPAFLSMFAGMEHGIVAARAAQWALSALAAAVTYLLARPLCRMPWLAGLAVACDPALVGSASLLLTETLFVTALVVLWWLALPLRHSAADTIGRWAAIGVAACLCVHLRESALLFVAALLAFPLVTRRDRRSVFGVAGVALMVFLSLVPWAYRNQRVLGQWVWLTTRGGISLYDGVRVGATGASDLADVKNAPEVADLSEVDWNRHFVQASRRAILDDPVRVLKLAPVKIARTWRPVLNAAEHQSAFTRVVFAAWYVPLYLLALVGLWAGRRKWDVVAALILPAVSVTLLHAVFVGSVRYRLGALPTLAVLAAIGAAHLVRVVGRDAHTRESRS
jgi:hypothetical protein